MTQSRLSSPAAVRLQWAGVLAGPSAWALDLTISYALVQWACAGRHTTVLRLITAVALAIIGAGALAAWRVRAQTGSTAAAASTGSTGLDVRRARFMAALGLWTCLLFALTVVATAIPRWVLDACHQ
jgi:hypothetical protein